jgi:Uracil DNA glycosylase superfamily
MVQGTGSWGIQIRMKIVEKNLRERSSTAKELAQVAQAIAGCERCPLYIDATQAVGGEGPAPAAIMLVGEQPGDQEDRAGHPFVGPAGRLLDRALKESDLDRSNVFVTNVVKHLEILYLTCPAARCRPKRNGTLLEGASHGHPDTSHHYYSCSPPWWSRLVRPGALVLGASRS